MGFGLHNATDAPRSSRTGVGHAGAAIFERTTTPLATVLLASAYDRFSRFFNFRKPMILVFHTSRFEFPLVGERDLSEPEFRRSAKADHQTQSIVGLHWATKAHARTRRVGCALK